MIKQKPAQKAGFFIVLTFITIVLLSVRALKTAFN